MRAGTEKHRPGDLLIESSIAMIAIDNDGIITAWNNAASLLFDRSREEAKDWPLLKAIPSVKDDPDLHTAIERAMEGNKSFLSATADLPHRRHVETHVIPLQQDNRVVGVMLVIHDVSHRIAKELELRRLNDELKNRLRQLHLTTNELAQLTHIASHNIRGPIREIYTTVEGLLRTEAGVMSHSGRASFRRIQSSLNRMNLLLDDIVTLTQINIVEHPSTNVSLEELVKELKTELGKKMEDTETTLTVGEVCDIRAHRPQVMLLLHHIFSNIIKFTTPGPPQIHLHCEKTLYISQNGDTARTGEYYLLSITHNSFAFDNVDAAPTLQVPDNIDPRYYTGPAIALVIAGKIMEVHAGFLTIDKTVKGNTRINCYFPANS